MAFKVPFASAVTIVVVLELLLPGFGSLVLLLMEAPLLTLELLGTLELIVTTMVMVAAAPAGKVAIVSESTLPVRFNANEGPAVCCCATNVSLAGSVSFTDTLWASLGPLFVNWSV